MRGERERRWKSGRATGGVAVELQVVVQLSARLATNMHRARCSLVFVLALATAFAADGNADKKATDESTTTSTSSGLKIDVVYTPEVCSQKSKNGDMLTMHYKGTLQDGTTFDSR